MRIKGYHFDYYLLLTAVILLILGILFLSSVSAVFSQERFGKPWYYLFHQTIYGIVPGIILGFVVFRINLSKIKKWSFLIILGVLILMVLVFIPGLSIISGGAPRWLNLGFVSFQPSEFLKLAFIIYFSTLLGSRKISLMPFFVIIGVIILLLACQSDISTLGTIISTAIIMYFLAPTPFWHIVLITLLTAGAFLILIRLAPYRMKRLQVLLGLIKDPMGLGYQIKQILIAIGSGGIFGAGLTESYQKFGFIPQTISDSIFAIIAEETGFIGSLFLISLFMIFLWRGFAISKKTTDKSLQLLAVGISSWISIQALINIGAMVGILPLTGIPLPFISYGGSHLVVELIGVGILLNISRSVKK